MKTSNKILLGFVLLALAAQTTCFVIAHNYTTKHQPPNEAPQIKTESLEGQFSVISVEAPGFFSFEEADQITAGFYQSKDSVNLQFTCTIKNDTCFVQSDGKESPNHYRKMVLKAPAFKHLVMYKNTNVDLHGSFDSLLITNHGGRFLINNNSRAKFIKLNANNEAYNELRGLQMQIELDHSKTLVPDKSELINANIKNSSQLNLNNSPQSLQVHQDETSRLEVNNYNR